MDAFMSAIFGAKEVKASARVKIGNETRTATLRTMPTDTSEASFAEAAKHGVDLAVRVKGEEERTRTINGKGVYGAAAVSATCSVLGFTPPSQEPTAPSAERTRARRKDKDAPETSVPTTDVSGPTIG